MRKHIQLFLNNVHCQRINWILNWSQDFTLKKEWNAQSSGMEGDKWNGMIQTNFSSLYNFTISKCLIRIQGSVFWAMANSLPVIFSFLPVSYRDHSHQHLIEDIVTFVTYLAHYCHRPKHPGPQITTDLPSQLILSDLQ